MPPPPHSAPGLCQQPAAPLPAYLVVTPPQSGMEWATITGVIRQTPTDHHAPSNDAPTDSCATNHGTSTYNDTPTDFDTPIDQEIPKI